jgi:hypothetical protein
MGHTARPADIAARRVASGGSINPLAPLGVKKNIIEGTRILPETRDAIVVRRVHLRLHAMQEMARLEPNLWDRLDGLIEAGDPREIDALTQALLTLERIAASAAGEGPRGRKVLSGTDDTPKVGTEELRELIATLVRE